MGLLPETFTPSDLQSVYEVILDRPLDKRNFHRKVVPFDVLVETGESRSEAGRPVKLYRFDQHEYRALQDRGIDFEV